MKTRILKATSEAALLEAKALLLAGEVIVLPTDTLYGVAALASNPDAVARIYQAKNRPAEKAIPVFVTAIEDLQQVCRHIPAAAYPFLEQYWPGKLSVILPAAPTLPDIVASEARTVAVRWPDHAVVAQLMALVGQPLAVTSANISGADNPQSAAEVYQQLAGRVPLILDDGPTASQLGSTIIDLTQTPPQIVRQGDLQISQQALALFD